MAGLHCILINYALKINFIDVIINKTLYIYTKVLKYIFDRNKEYVLLKKVSFRYDLNE